MAGSSWYKLCVLVSFAFTAAHYPQAQSVRADERKAPEPVKAADMNSLWRDPGDIASLDLSFGQGGKEHAPRPDAMYTFEKEDMGGSTAKFYVKDQDGVEWLVKVGEEAQPETAATRFVWAMGYFTDEDYFLPELHVSGMTKLHRKSKSIEKDGTIVNARLKRGDKGQKKLANWAWDENPFVGTRQLNGLRVMMALINNWDLKTVNNKIYGAKEDANDTTKNGGGKDDESVDTDQYARGDVRYVVSDLGASFGRTGGFETRSKGNVKDYEKDNFIAHTNPDTVDFVMRTKPGAILRHLKPGYYEKRVEMADQVKGVPRADARWIGGQLAKLTPEQMRSAFTAAGFTAKETDEYLDELRERIAELNAL